MDHGKRQGGWRRSCKRGREAAPAGRNPSGVWHLGLASPNSWKTLKAAQYKAQSLEHAEFSLFLNNFMLQRPFLLRHLLLLLMMMMLLLLLLSPLALFLCAPYALVPLCRLAFLLLSHCPTAPLLALLSLPVIELPARTDSTPASRNLISLQTRQPNRHTVGTRGGRTVCIPPAHARRNL